MALGYPVLSWVDPTERVGRQRRPSRMVSDAQSHSFRHIHRMLKMADNLNIKGIRDDEPHARGRAHPHGKRRKPFALECRLVHDPDAHPNCIFSTLSLGEWWVWRRYTTASRRDQAYATLVRKEEAGRISRWSRWGYRKHDD